MARAVADGAAAKTVPEIGRAGLENGELQWPAADPFHASATLDRRLAEPSRGALRGTGRRLVRRISAAVALGVASLGAQGSPPPASPYETSVEGYARGEPDGGLSSLILASPQTLRGFSNGARGGVDGVFRVAEITLNTDIALARFANEGLDGFDARVSLLEYLDRPGLAPRFRASWRLAVAAVYLQFYEAQSARKQIERALEIDGKDPLLLVVLGATFEQRTAGGPTQVTTYGVTQDRSLISGYFRSKARDAYQRALRLDPECADARLRLAWTLADEGRPGLGIDHADWVRQHAPEPDLLYVALLLTGRDLERRGSPAEAAQHYVEASRADPRGSVAPFAASHALQAAGDPEAAGGLLLQALRARDAGEYVDPWQGHYQGRAAWLRGAIAAMRESVAARW
jgi:hypothetical protein